jgi:hypothetical protein
LGGNEREITVVGVEDELHFLMYCPRFENHRRELFSNVLNYNAARLSAEDKFVWILSNEDPSKTCKNVSMANISIIRNISFVSKYKLKFSICPKFLTFV